MGVPRSWPNERLIGSRFRRLGQAVFIFSSALGVNEAKPIAPGTMAERRLGQRAGLRIEIVHEIAVTLAVEEIEEVAKALLAAGPTVIFDHHSPDVGEPVFL